MVRLAVHAAALGSPGNTVQPFGRGCITELRFDDEGVLTSECRQIHASVVDSADVEGSAVQRDLLDAHCLEVGESHDVIALAAEADLAAGPERVRALAEVQGHVVRRDV